MCRWFSDLCESRGLQQLLRRAGPVNTDGAQQHHAAVHLVPGLQGVTEEWEFKNDIVIISNSEENKNVSIHTMVWGRTSFLKLRK